MDGCIFFHDTLLRSVLDHFHQYIRASVHLAVHINQNISTSLSNFEFIYLHVRCTMSATSFDGFSSYHLYLVLMAYSSFNSANFAKFIPKQLLALCPPLVIYSVPFQLFAGTSCT